jgi:hypothetical protein
MRPAAEVEPFVLVIDLQVLPGRYRIDEFDLEGLALVAEHLLGLVTAPDFARERSVARNDLAHLRLDRRKILGGERLVAEEVVIEAVFDHRADGDLRARPQRLHGLGHDMGGVVADQLERLRAFARNDLDPGIRADLLGEVG